MVHELMELGWVHRVRAADRRTWLVMLTEKGREVFRQPLEEVVNSGDVVSLLERGLEQVQDKTLEVRNTLWWYCERLTEAFRTRPAWRGEDLYLCDPEDYYHWLVDFGEKSWGLPWVSELPLPEDAVEVST
jgi:DNA-binding MarR family transcriptional regulator